MADFHNPFKNSVHNVKNKSNKHLQIKRWSILRFLKYLSINIAYVSIPTKPWPATLPEQVRAVAEVLAASPIPPNLPAIEVRFKGKGPWKKGLPLLLQTLQALDRAWPIEGL